MNIRASIEQRQIQSMAITAEVIQSINILQFSHDELLAYLAEQAEQNPLIDLSVVPENALNQLPAQEGKKQSDLAPADSSAGEEQHGNTDGHQWSFSQGTGLVDRNRDVSSLEDYTAVRMTLREHLHAQASLTFRGAVDRALSSEIIESLDDDGYFRRPLREIAELHHVAQEHVQAVLETVQTFDPVGVGAVDLAQCLKLQLKEMGRLDVAMSTLLDNLQLLAAFDFAKLVRLCGVDREEILVLAKEIRGLDPRPGRQFEDEPVLPALPDVIVKRKGDTFLVELNTALLPKVLVDREYSAEISRTALGSDEKRYLRDCIRNANWLIRNVDQRANTVLKVATEIVALQRDFLVRGVEHLRPLKLRDVAEAAGVHESTVCRAISNKYMFTSRGVFELKYFMAKSIAGAEGGENCSSETVRHRIKQMISLEAADTALSDDEIVLALRRSGIHIARRTVAKYREMMNIPSSLRRRRQKLAQREVPALPAC